MGPENWPLNKFPQQRLLCPPSLKIVKDMPCASSVSHGLPGQQYRNWPVWPFMLLPSDLWLFPPLLIQSNTEWAEFWFPQKEEPKIWVIQVWWEDLLARRNGQMNSLYVLFWRSVLRTCLEINSWSSWAESSGNVSMDHFRSPLAYCLDTNPCCPGLHFSVKDQCSMLAPGSGFFKNLSKYKKQYSLDYSLRSLEYIVSFVFDPFLPLNSGVCW